MDRVVRGIKQTIYKSPVWRMGHNIGQSGRKNGGCEGGKSVRETASDCRSVRLVAARCFADLDAGHDRCVPPGGRHDAQATAWHGLVQRPRAAPRPWHPAQRASRRACSAARRGRLGQATAHAAQHGACDQQRRGTVRTRSAPGVGRGVHAVPSGHGVAARPHYGPP